MGVYKYTGISIPVYTICEKDNAGELAHIEAHFEKRPEFELNIVPIQDVAHTNSGFHEAFAKILHQAMEDKETVIILCKPNHRFAPEYDQTTFFESITAAYNQGGELLLGNLIRFNHAVPLDKNRYWIDHFYGSNFIVIFQKLFQKIIESKVFDLSNLDETISGLTLNKMVLFPFISNGGFQYPEMEQTDLNHSVRKLDTYRTVFEKYVGFTVAPKK